MSSEDLDKVAILRVMECANGVVQHMFRGNHPGKLSDEDTRKAMQFSMGSIKRLTIDLGDEVITFEEHLGELIAEMRELYIDGIKKHIPEAYDEFFVASDATVKACGRERIENATNKLKEKIAEHIPPHAIQWGADYLEQFL